MEGIDFRRLKGMLVARGIKAEEFAGKVGMSVSTLRQVMGGSALTTSDRVAAICAALECSVNDVVEFTGYEVAERYGRRMREYYPAVYNEVSYEPLRHLFKGNYKENWKRKLNGLFDSVESTASDRQLEECRKGIAAMKGVTGGLTRRGLSGNIRHRLREDEGVNMRVIYNICRVLKCTPDYVMEYK